MTLYEQIMAIYPHLTVDDFMMTTGTILLQNDGKGDYIKSWTNTNPKPTAEQLTATGL